MFISTTAISMNTQTVSCNIGRSRIASKDVACLIPLVTPRMVLDRAGRPCS